MTIQLFETKEDHSRLLPLTYTRSVGDLRVGILTIAEKWAKYLQGEVAHHTVDYLQKKYPEGHSPDFIISAALLPDEALVKQVKNLKPGEGLYLGGKLVAARTDAERRSHMSDFAKTDYVGVISHIEYPWDLFRINGQEIRKDYQLLTAGRFSQPINDPATTTYGSEIFVEEGAKIKAAILNAESGPIYIGKNAEIQEGALVRGPFAICESSVVNMGGKMRGDNTIGPFSKVGGEVSNSILIGYSNKGHDGFLGNSVLGEWCNLGADSNNSNLKNNYTNIKMWDFETGRFKDTGLQFCGLIMGDHSKCGINTMFNTGTTVGVSANIFGEGFPRTFIPSFAWGGNKGFVTYQTNKAFDTATLVMERRGKSLSDVDRQILSDIFDQTSNYRSWEKS
jgi:UDP-N-acetylglucosamine diphosphorylase/glucosamine-1-phosphate N-acetyltransferase